jgi:hypothetical protein
LIFTPTWFSLMPTMAAISLGEAVERQRTARSTSLSLAI